MSSAALASDLFLGRYRPLKPLGSGGMGHVWLARDERSGLDVSLKIVAREGKSAMAFVLRGFQIALAATDGFSKLLAAGLSFGFAFQAFVIVGGITRVIPLTGITLPFVSYGGSSIVANFLLVAGLMLISNRANREGTGA